MENLPALIGVPVLLFLEVLFPEGVLNPGGWPVFVFLLMVPGRSSRDLKAPLEAARRVHVPVAASASPPRARWKGLEADLWPGLPLAPGKVQRRGSLHGLRTWELALERWAHLPGPPRFCARG